MLFLLFQLYEDAVLDNDKLKKEVKLLQLDLQDAKSEISKQRNDTRSGDAMSDKRVRPSCSELVRCHDSTWTTFMLCPHSQPPIFFLSQ